MFAFLQVTRQQKDEDIFVRRYVRRVWLRTWCAMVRYNTIACRSDTRDGFLRPRAAINARARKTGPYPALRWNEADERGGPRRPGADALGTYTTPVVVRRSAVTQRYRPVSTQT